MWRVYRRTRKDEDFTNYKEALNAATAEIKNLKENMSVTVPEAKSQGAKSQGAKSQEAKSQEAKSQEAKSQEAKSDYLG